MKHRKLVAGITSKEVPHLPPVSPLPGVRDLRNQSPGLWTELISIMVINSVSAHFPYYYSIMIIIIIVVITIFYCYCYYYY